MLWVSIFELLYKNKLCESENRDLTAHLRSLVVVKLIFAEISRMRQTPKLMQAIVSPEDNTF